MGEEFQPWLYPPPFCERGFSLLIPFLLLIPVISAYDQTFMTAPNLMTIDNAQILFFEIVDPGTLRYLFKLRPAKDFGTSFSERAFYHSKLVPTNPIDACSDLKNVNQIRGSIALVRRGSCSFVSKASKAELAGARGMFVVDHDKDNDDQYIQMIQDNTGRKTSIPCGFILGRDGYHILRVLKAHGSDFAIINIPVNVTTSELYLKQPPWTIW